MPLTQKNICAIVGKSPDALRRYPRVKDLLQQHNRLSQSRKRFLAKIKGDELHQRIEAIIRELEDLGQSVTLAAICSRIGIRQEELIHYPQIETLIKQIKENYRQHRLEQAKQCDEQLLAQVEAAIRQLAETKQPISIRAIGRIVGLSPSGFYRYS